MTGAGEDGRDPGGGDHGQAKEQIPPPTDLLAEEDKCGDDRAYADVKKAAHQAGTKPRKANDAERSGDAEAQGSDQHRSEDSDQQASTPPRMKPDGREDGTSLAPGDGDRHGDREAEHWRGDAEHRCDAGVRKRKGDRDRDCVGGEKKDEDLTKRAISPWWPGFGGHSLLRHFI